MSVINIPKQYKNAPGILAQAGAFIEKIGKTAWIIAGDTALKSVQDPFVKSLQDYGIAYDVEIFRGYPTVEKVEHYTNIVSEGNYDLVIGIGGGKVLDAAKAVAEKAGVPVVTVPTIPATCAAWSALSVLYKEDGEQDRYFYLKNSPVLILADKEILKKAPIHYLHAGIADSIVKWYEIASNFNQNQNDFALRLQLKVCELILAFLEEEYIEIYCKNPDGIPESVKDNAIDSIIMLAGLAGSISGKVSYGGLAHHFYNQSTKVPSARKRLHGEIVVYGLIVQFIIEERKADFIRNYIAKLKRLSLPVTLEDLGIAENQEEHVHTIADSIYKRVPEYAGTKQTLSVEAIERAILEADTLGRNLGL